MDPPPRSFHTHFQTTHIIHITMNENSHRGPDGPGPSCSRLTSLMLPPPDTIPGLALTHPNRLDAWDFVMPTWETQRAHQA